MQLLDYFKHLYDHKLTGTQIDKGIVVVMGNFLEDKPVFCINLTKNSEYMLTMLKDANRKFLFIAGGIFHFCAYYDFDKESPIGRIYYVSEENMFKAPQILTNLEKLGHKLPFLLNEEFSETIKENGYKQRIKEYKDRTEKENKYYGDFVKGRINSTSVDQGFYLKTKNCIVCGEETSTLASGTMAHKVSGVMIGFHLCENHFTEAQASDSFLSYLYAKWNLNLSVTTRSLSTEENIFYTLLILENELECEVFGINGNTITAVRKTSAFKVILRLDSITDYGYMIFNKEGKQLARFDTANHHDVEYGPDHVHPDLSQKKVESSFTTGLPELDYKSILRVIEYFENHK
tara:strand:+ start:2459 stop:3499 length:1041 start_codon:yes stop_codon:yes gene_type:complete